VEVAREDSAQDSSGSRSAFRSLYESTFREIFEFVVRSRISGSEAEDVVAEIYLAAWRRISDVPAPPDDRLWMYGVARNTLARAERTRHRRNRLLSRLSSQPHTGVLPSEPHSSYPEVLEAVSHLPSREREVVQLIYWDGLSTDEAATVIGCSPNAARIRLHRAKKRLSRRLGVLEASAGPLPIDLDLETPK
jgi:RNA polymerase sigma factor (sigma-70 family)